MDGAWRELAATKYNCNRQRPFTHQELLKVKLLVSNILHCSSTTFDMPRRGPPTVNIQTIVKFKFAGVKAAAVFVLFSPAKYAFTPQRDRLSFTLLGLAEGEACTCEKVCYYVPYEPLGILKDVDKRSHIISFPTLDLIAVGRSA